MLQLSENALITYMFFKQLACLFTEMTAKQLKDLFSGAKLLNENDEEVEAMSILEDKEIIGLLFINKRWNQRILKQHRLFESQLRNFYGTQKIEV